MGGTRMQHGHAGGSCRLGFSPPCLLSALSADLSCLRALQQHLRHTRGSMGLDNTSMRVSFVRRTLLDDALQSDTPLPRRALRARAGAHQHPGAPLVSPASLQHLGLLGTALVWGPPTASTIVRSGRAGVAADGISRPRTRTTSSPASRSPPWTTSGRRCMEMRRGRPRCC